MADALVAGLLVGLSVAVLAGGPAMLVMETAVHRGVRVALAAGCGIATGDGIWAALAGGAGLAVGRLLAPWAGALQWTAVGVLAILLMAVVRDLFSRSTIRQRRMDPIAVRASPRRAYGEFLAHTLGDIVTGVFFVSIIIGAAPGYRADDAAAFAAGAFLSSLSWQLFLVVAGTRRGERFSDRARRRFLAVDCALLGLFLAYIALGLYRH